MKRMFTIIIMCLLSITSALAQAISIDKTDVFTSERIIETYEYTLYRGEGHNCPLGYNIHIDNAGTVLIVRLDRVTDFQYADSIVPKLKMLNENGDIIILYGQNIYAKEEVATSNIHWGFGISTGSQVNVTNIKIDIPITKSEVQKIAESKITNIQMEIGENKYNYSLKKNDIRLLQMTFTDVMPYIN